MKYFFLSLFMGLDLWAQAAPTPKSDFLSLCKATFSQQAQRLPMCEEINQKFFSQSKQSDIASITPGALGARPSAVDGKIEFLVFNDPNYLPAIAYCYFVFRNWVSSSTFSPDDMGMNASGFSILNEDLKKYQQWLVEAVEGKKCKARVEKESQVTVVNLEETLKNKVALIGLNPYASLHAPNPTTQSVVQEMLLTLNHERIHAFHVACPEFEKWSIKEWEKLPAAKKNEYVKKYPSYNWTVPKIAGREYIAFLYEANPEMIGPHVSHCKL